MGLVSGKIMADDAEVAAAVGAAEGGARLAAAVFDGLAAAPEVALAEPPELLG